MPNIPLKSQGKEDYFYGKDGIIEDYLGELENRAAPILMEIIEDKILPKKESEKYADLLLFCFVMGNRTVDAAEKIKETVDETIRTIMRYDDRFKDKVVTLRIYPENPSGMAIETMLKAIKLVTDLRLKLFVNKTNIKFLSSDNPLIRYNQFLEQRKHPGGIVGLATKGLQVFLPISPNEMLCFYDDMVYRIGDNQQQVINITDQNDVNTLNGLQVVQCLDKIFFNSHQSEYYVRNLAEKWKRKRVTKYSENILYQSHIDEEGNEHIVHHQYNNDPRLGIQFSFARQTKKAKEYVLSDFAVQLRNESLRFKR